MIGAPVRASQRYTRDHPCPICGGCHTDPPGQGVRCWGFLSDDGTYARCTRDEHAGALVYHEAGYAHWLSGPCRCGTEHSTPAPRPRLLPGVSARKGQDSTGPFAGTWECVYVYRSADGQPVHRTVRFREPKSFRQQRYEDGEWRWGLGETETVLYRLPELLAADLTALVFLAEGEKDADRLAGLGLVATTLVCNAWRPQYRHWFAGRHCILLEDNDAAGQHRSAVLGQQLHGIAASLRYLAFPGVGESGDVSDWLDAGGTVTALLAAARGIAVVREVSE